MQRYPDDPLGEVEDARDVPTWSATYDEGEHAIMEEDKLPSLDVTWSVLDEDEGLDDMMEQVREVL